MEMSEKLKKFFTTNVRECECIHCGATAIIQKTIPDEDLIDLPCMGCENVGHKLVEQKGESNVERTDS